MYEVHIVMCDSQNKVHSYLAHPLFAPVQVEMRASCNFLFAIFMSAAAPEYNDIFFVICIVL